MKNNNNETVSITVNKKTLRVGLACVALLGAAVAVGHYYEYTPNQIKMSLTGYGAAKKAQIEEMVRVHLGLETKPKPDDAADALAVAITCSFLYHLGNKEKYKFANNRKEDDDSSY